MKHIPSCRGFSHFRTYSLLTLFLLVSCGGVILYGPAPAVVTAQGSRGGVQLRSAVASKSEAELQRVEAAFAGTEEAALARFLRGYLRLQARDFGNAAAILADQNIGSLTAIGDYALYYRAQALQESGRNDDAEREFRNLSRNYPASILARSAALQAAGAAMAQGNYTTVIQDLAELVDKNDGTALKMRADALEKLGRRNEAIITLRKLYFDAPQSAEAEKVSERLAGLGGSTAPADGAQLKRRADNLFEAGLYLIAGQAYDQIGRQFPGQADDEVWLRAGISYYKGNSFRQSADALNRIRARTPKIMSDAGYYLAAATLSMDNEPAALQALAEMRRTAPGSPRIADLLHLFGRYHEKRGRDTQAASYYTQLVRQYPRSEPADEAHYWLAWRAHEAKDYATSSRMLLEHVADYNGVTDNRGKAGFWAAVDTERTGDKARALTLYRAMLMRYGAGWFGVNAERRIEQLTKQGVQAGSIHSDPLLRRAVEGLQTIKLPRETINSTGRQHVSRAEQLIRISFLQSAMSELDAAKAASPDSPIVSLRRAQIYRLNGENVAALIALQKAYPDYGQTLPEEMSREVWDVFYPLKYWSNIKEEAARHGLDPYLIAGIIRQETVFNPQARSRANALGLMQLLPSTGRAVAKRTSHVDNGISNNDLFNPVINIQLGTAYVKQLMGQFGRFEYVAAAYNGGPTRVRRWLNENPMNEIEEWVENIPLSETRLYVQGVYRNARQYQRLYDQEGRFRSNVPQ